MGVLFDSIRRLVMDGRYIIGQHAVERLDERSILEWQVVDGIATGTLVVELDRKGDTFTAFADVFSRG